MTNDSSDRAPVEAGAGRAPRAAVTPLGRALPRVLVFGAFVLLAALAYVLDARTHLRPLAAVTFASASVLVIALTEFGIAYLERLASTRPSRPSGRQSNDIG